MVREEVKSGKVLLAEPFMLDPNFKRSAVLLCEHSREGSIGFIMNKPLQMRIDELIEGFPEFNSEVFFGGPVQTDTVHFIHNIGDLLDDSVLISSGVYWGGDFEKLKFLISSDMISERNIRFFVGYSGWSEGQLTDEMTYGSWIMANMDSNYLFKLQPKELWESAYTVISQIPELLSWN
jgi:putative transcriptional regulator